MAKIQSNDRFGINKDLVDGEVEEGGEVGVASTSSALCKSSYTKCAGSG